LEKKYDARCKIGFDTIFSRIYSGEYIPLESKKKNNSQKKVTPLSAWLVKKQVLGAPS
jgi:hypothetical protein